MWKSYKTLLLIFGLTLLELGYKKFFYSFASLYQGTYSNGSVDSLIGKFTADSYFKN
ncbi:hypothetical protein [Cytobacillus praedii]|uniref:hypothetical protein n=1 Tax=Cytobacillus praedii TaxID=1742358 RepID=UPI002E2355D4|nr:hypothetical protein [Cytobacillus praedii]